MCFLDRHETRAPSMRLPILIALVATWASCAHAPPVQDVDLTGQWVGSGVAVPRDSRGPVPGSAVRLWFELDLVDDGGRISGTGTIGPADLPGTPKPITITGTLRNGRLRLRMALPEPFTPNMLIGGLRDAATIEGTVGQARFMTSPGGDMNAFPVTLERVSTP